MYMIDSSWFGSGGEITEAGFSALAAGLERLGYEVWKHRRCGAIVGLAVKPEPTEQHWQMLANELCSDDRLVRLVAGGSK